MPSDFSTSDPSLAIVAGLLVLATVGAAFVAKALRRSRPHRFQDDAEHARANSIMRTEGEVERIRSEMAYWTKTRKRKVPAYLHVELHNAKVRLDALTAANEA